MILAVDIGNTNITIGGFEEEALCFVVRLTTNAVKTADEYASKIRSILSGRGVTQAAVEGAVISSVVPPLNSVMKEAIRFTYGVSPLFVGPGIKTGLNLHCDNPSSVGADLICACVAAQNLYQTPSLVVDMGTATKIMALDDAGAFIGVSIMPGVQIGLKALTAGTAQLPQIDLEAPKSVIGKNTVDCMRSGVVFGNAALIDGMIDRFYEALGKSVPVYATGGYAATVLPHCRHSITVDADLVLKGLYILYKKNKTTE